MLRFLVMTRIVFLTLFLGLTMGRQQVAVTVSGPVARVELALDGRTAAVITGEPWRASVDFGTHLVPRRLVARALDEHGAELARIEQRVNLPSRTSAAALVLESPRSVRLIWQSVDSEQPKDVQWMLDGAPLNASALTASLPELDLEKPHLVRAVATSSGGQVTDAELIFGGGLTDAAASALTAVPLRVERANAAIPASLTIGGKRPDIIAVEQLPADIIFVRDPSQTELALRIEAGNRLRRRAGPPAAGTATTIAHGARFVWPVATRTKGTSAAELFASSRSFSVKDFAGVQWVLANISAPKADSLRFADAVAVAGLQAATSRRPRAVVLITGSRHNDGSRLTPAQAREYLASIGVPLFVWCITDFEPAGWDEVRRIDTSERFRDAANDLLGEIQRQRIVWIGGDHMLDEILVSGAGVKPLWSLIHDP